MRRCETGESSFLLFAQVCCHMCCEFYLQCFHAIHLSDIAIVGLALLGDQLQKLLKLQAAACLAAAAALATALSLECFRSICLNPSRLLMAA
mmetsp:Transcript_20575/g.61937  ORF Transcript_20575/g.61937 Transcript_20575/m.61937 type:complete len:92 (-) Transcript_20575:571-846(-)